jgi:hypothetical protein
MLHRTRHLFIRQQTAVINAIRALILARLRGTTLADRSAISLRFSDAALQLGRNLRPPQALALVPGPRKPGAEHVPEGGDPFRCLTCSI